MNTGRVLSTAAVLWVVAIGAGASEIDRCLKVASAVASRQGLSVEKGGAVGSLVISGSHEGENYQLYLRFADNGGQLVLASGSHSRATILEARSSAERRYYEGFWAAAAAENLNLVPVSDYAANTTLLAPLLGKTDTGAIVVLETADMHVVVADLTQGTPPPTVSDWGTFNVAGIGLEPFENSYRLIWVVSLSTQLTGEIMVEVDEVAGPEVDRLFSSKTSIRDGVILAQSHGLPIGRESFPWLFDGLDTLFVLRVRLEQNDHQRVLYQPVLYSAQVKKQSLEALGAR